MNDRSLMEMQISIAPMRGLIPADKPLEERLAFAMDYVRKHERDLFWMSYSVNDDMMFRSAIAAVMIDGSEEDKLSIQRSMKPLQMLAAAANGIPVDFEFMDTENLIPLLKLWHASAEKH